MKRLFFVLLIILVGTVGLGYYRGWFGVSTAEAGGKKGLVLTWNADKVKADMAQAGSKLKSMSQGVVDKIKGKAKEVSATVSELEGTITGVDATTHTVTLDSDGNSIPLVVADTANVEQLNGKTVRVTLEKSGDTMIVTKIEEK
ncbi:MAG: hypothetical protein R3F56_12030 [Planctomycetota bacterium]